MGARVQCACRFELRGTHSRRCSPGTCERLPESKGEREAGHAGWLEHMVRVALNSHSYASSVLSSWRTRPVCESALGMVIIE